VVVLVSELMGALMYLGCIDLALVLVLDLAALVLISRLLNMLQSTEVGDCEEGVDGEHS